MTTETTKSQTLGELKLASVKVGYRRCFSVRNVTKSWEDRQEVGLGLVLEVAKDSYSYYVIVVL